MMDSFVVVIERKVTQNKEVIIDGVVCLRPSRPAGEGWAETDVRVKSTMWSRVKLKYSHDEHMALSTGMTYFEEDFFKSIAAYMRDLAK